MVLDHIVVDWLPAYGFTPINRYHHNLSSSVDGLMYVNNEVRQN